MKSFMESNWLVLFIIGAFLCALAIHARADADITEQVVMVNQNGELNTEAVASVESVVSNSVRVAVAQAKAEAAQSTAQQVSAAISGVAANLMSGNVVIYRKGFMDGFEAMVFFTADDKLIISDLTLVPANNTASTICVDISYASTVDLGTIKPIVHYHDSLQTDRAEWDIVDEASITEPVFHSGEITRGGQTYSGYYTIRCTIPKSDALRQFYYIGVDADAPAGDGSTLDIVNGVSGGVTAEVTWGDKILTFTGGVLMGVRDVQ